MNKITGLALLTVIGTAIFSSCGKDDAPQDTDLFIGTYKGNIGYVSSSDSKSSSDGKVTVSKIGSTYNFAFSDGIPNVNGIKFEKENDEFYINIGGSGTSYIRINESTLKMLYISSGETWTADCSR